MGKNRSKAKQPSSGGVSPAGNAANEPVEQQVLSRENERAKKKQTK